MLKHVRILVVASFLLNSLWLSGCGSPSPAPEAQKPEKRGLRVGGDGVGHRPDIHSYARFGEVRIEHISLDLTVDFDSRTLSGSASLRLAEHSAKNLHLDSRDLEIRSVTLDGGEQTTYSLSSPDPFLGQDLSVAIQPETREVKIEYSTSPEAAALQWLTPEQTAGGEHPFLFSQSQAILARTWVPCQDTPAVRFTYDAVLRVPSELTALMSAENPTQRSADGVYSFSMPQAIPSYLLAVAVGDLEFASLGERSGIYAEPSVVEGAAWEFADTEAMMEAVEELYGPYRWGRYDILVLPPSFPFGGMENPRLTFATPTILAGDRSLVSLIAHELAHSWSGNLVTNATWNDFWLNEGFTTYLEIRIMEAIYGEETARMLALLSRQDLDAYLEDLGAESRDSHLALNLTGRDPDDGMSAIAYDKGRLFLALIEETVGRERFDEWLRSYFDRYAFRSLTTEEFVAELNRELLSENAEWEAQVDATRWIYGPGVPDNAPQVTSDAFDLVDAQIASWIGGIPAAQLEVEDWSTNHWLHFLRSLPEDLDAAFLKDLDSAFGFTESGNSEILHAWLHHTIRHGYEPADAALEEFLTGMGRRKFLMPLYRRLAETEEGLARAREIYAEARAGYHPLAVASVDELLR